MSNTSVITLNGKEIKVNGVGINNQLTAKQKALLILINKCVEDNDPLNWDKMVDFYSDTHNYPKEIIHDAYDWVGDSIVYYKKKKMTDLRAIRKDYMEKGEDNGWTWYWAPRIRQWFANNMGSMILKGSLIALPIIELE